VTVTSREERDGLKIFEIGVLRNIVGPKWDEVIGDWRRLLNVVFAICTARQILSG
jgi:hypothetical protein